MSPVTTIGHALGRSRIPAIEGPWEQVAPKAVTINQKADASGPLASSARQLFATAENYPELKANDTFLQLQKRITELEEQIADRREVYNDSVNTFNIRMREMPDSFVARLMRLNPRQMFKVNETERAPARVVWDEVMR